MGVHATNARAKVMLAFADLWRAIGPLTPPGDASRAAEERLREARAHVDHAIAAHGAWCEDCGYPESADGCARCGWRPDRDDGAPQTA